MSSNTGTLNTILGHRGYWHECSFWLRETFNGSVPNNQLAYSKKPDGEFFGEQIGDYVYGDTNLSSVTYDTQSVSIRTRDDVSALRKKDLVKFDNKIWIVDGVRKHLLRQRKQLCNGSDLFEYTITMSR